MTPGQYIKYLRKRNNLSQEKLAEDLNFERSTIAKYEANINQMKYDTIKIFSNYFNEPIINIINGDEYAYNKISFDNEEYIKNYYEYILEKHKNKTKYNILKIILTFLIITITLITLIFYLYNKYQKTKSYSLIIENSNIKETSIMLDTSDEIHIYISNISIPNEKVISATLYYKENNEKYFIKQIIDDNITSFYLYDNINEQQYIDFTNKDNIINNLYIIFKTNNNTYDNKLSKYLISPKKVSFINLKKKKENYKLDEKIKTNIYNFNTTINYLNNDYIVTANKDTITIKCKNNNTNITIRNNLYIGSFNDENIVINKNDNNNFESFNIKKIDEIINIALKNTSFEN